MERKRKLPARAAARNDHVAKKRTVTPPKEPSPTPSPAQPAVEEPITAQHTPSAQLPTSIQSGKALPTVENVQPEDLSSKDFQSVQESGVLAESLQRSRNRWIAEGLFEKYWTKPTKRKSVTTEDSKNPAKDTMTKLGSVVITIEPHVFDATMYAVKYPTPSLPPPPPPPPTPPTTASSRASAVFRPIMQYGPPNGAMPPPATPVPTPPLLKSATSTTAAAPDARSSRPSTPQVPTTASPALRQESNTKHSDAAKPETVPSISQSPKPAPAPASQSMSQSPSTQSALGGVPPPPSATSHVTSPNQSHSRQPPAPSPQIAASPITQTSGVSAPGTPGASSVSKPPVSNDPIISTLAAKAATDPYLREVMKRVAGGCAKPDEMAHFQSVIEEISLEYKRKGGPQGPPLDKVLVDGKSVKYYADEVRSILDIVLMSNPQQRSSDLKAPRGSNPLVIALVRTALDDNRTRETIRRIADGKHIFTDPTDLKAVLDKLKKSIPAPHPKSPAPVQSPHLTNGAGGAANGRTTASSPSPALTSQQSNQQALRSKGLAPAPPAAAPPSSSSQLQLSAMAFEFASGNGDRYLFPKFSILEFAPGDQQVVASFFIVRKGSTSEYGGDPALDYYQPVTIRISGRSLEHLARVVAPPDEVRRYMDDVMDNMTRAEYVILAMRLPRTPREMTETNADETSPQQQQLQEQQHSRDSEEPNYRMGGKSTHKTGLEVLQPLRPQNPGVLWTARIGKAGGGEGHRKSRGTDGDHEKQSEYRRFIHSVAAKETETV